MYANCCLRRARQQTFCLLVLLIFLGYLLLLKSRAALVEYFLVIPLFMVCLLNHHRIHPILRFFGVLDAVDQQFDARHAKVVTGIDIDRDLIADRLAVTWRAQGNVRGGIVGGTNVGGHLGGGQGVHPATTVVGIPAAFAQINRGVAEHRRNVGRRHRPRPS